MPSFTYGLVRGLSSGWFVRDLVCILYPYSITYSVGPLNLKREANFIIGKLPIKPYAK